MLSFLPETTCQNLAVSFLPVVQSLVPSFLTLGFIRRQANMVAYALARKAMSLASSAVYFEICNCIEFSLLMKCYKHVSKKKKKTYITVVRKTYIIP